MTGEVVEEKETILVPDPPRARKKQRVEAPPLLTQTTKTWHVPAKQAFLQTQDKSLQLPAIWVFCVYDAAKGAWVALELATEGKVPWVITSKPTDTTIQHIKPNRGKYIHTASARQVFATITGGVCGAGVWLRVCGAEPHTGHIFVGYTYPRLPFIGHGGGGGGGNAFMFIDKYTEGREKEGEEGEEEKEKKMKEIGRAGVEV